MIDSWVIFFGEIWCKFLSRVKGLNSCPNKPILLLGCVPVNFHWIFKHVVKECLTLGTWNNWGIQEICTLGYCTSFCPHQYTVMCYTVHLTFCSFRFFRFSCVPSLYNITSKDIMYCTLPLYHSGGGALGVGACLLQGVTLVLRKKFSASKFWEECIEHKVTVSS